MSCYIIRGRFESDTIAKYLSVDPIDGGDPYWSESLSEAKMFTSKDSAIEYINSKPDFTSECVFINGEVTSPRMISSIGVSPTGDSGMVKLEICEIQLNIKKSYSVRWYKKTIPVSRINDYLRKITKY